MNRMKLVLLLSVPALVCGLALSLALAHDPSAGVASTLKNFFAAMESKDEDSARKCLDDVVLSIQSGKDPQVDVLKIAKAQKLTPKDDQWKGLTVSDIRVCFTDHAASVAVVSYILTAPLSQQEIDGLQEFLEIDNNTISNEQRELLSKQLRDKAKKHQLFATLIRREDVWKIATLFLPS